MRAIKIAAASAVMLLALTFAAPSSAWAPRPDHPRNYRGAPGPLLGAGLPMLILIGGGAYWAIRRYRAK
jgi:hypothetical protein